MCALPSPVLGSHDRPRFRFLYCPCYEARSHDDLGGLSSNDWRYRTFLQVCAPAGSRSLLDVGCGDGRFRALAQTAGYDVHGVDVDARAVQMASHEASRMSGPEAGR
jgi:2-polyprenyl-3-methyl-5-hydroxy-6-metoxy-1,4-benzoquinol methylase